MRKHTDEELIEELIRLKNQLGRNPLQTDFAIHSKYSVNSYKRAFGGLSKALIKIGEKPNIKLDSSNYNILEEIKRVYGILKHPPDTNEFSEHSDISYAAVRRSLNNPSWYKLLIEAGIPIDEVARMGKHNITEDDLRAEVIRLKSILGRYPSYHEMATTGLYSAVTYEQRYGTYIKAMHALGFTDYESKSFFHNQTHTLGKDGVKYKSLFEAETANYLLKLVESNQIKKYEYERLVCNDKKWTCDFYIELNDGSDIWIEADGMAHNRREPYGLENKKIKYYIDHSYKFFILKYRKNLKIQLDAIFEYLKPNTCDTVITVNNQILTKEYVSSLPEETRENLIEDVFEYFRERSFPYLDSKEDAKKEFNRLKAYTPNINEASVDNNSSLGTYICKYYCRSFFAAKTKGDLNLLEVFYNDDLLKKVIKNRLSIGWTLKGGVHEFFNITPKMILQGMRSSRTGSCVSMFKPSAAKYIYMKYSNEGDTVYDYSAGFGGRLLGAVSCNRKYIGIDPATSDSLNKMIDDLNLQDCLVMQGCSEEYKNSENSIDLAFSSPPYFDQEIYTDDDTQAYNKGPEYFYDVYWNTTLINIKHMLKAGKYFILNVKNDKMFEMAKKYFQYDHVIDLKTVKAPMNKTNKRSATKNEGIYVFINNK